MGACQTSSTGGEFQDSNMQSEGRLRQIKKSQQPTNPFFDYDAQDTNGQNVLDNYNFHSTYNDKFVGECSVLEDKQTKNLYLAKQQIFSEDKEFEQRYQDLKKKKDTLTHENVLQVKDIVGKTTDGFFSQHKKLIAIIDYPFINMHKQIANRTSKKIPFNPVQIRSIIASTIRGYNSITEAGYPTDKVRLRYIFFGIHNRQSIIKVTEGSLITNQNNYQSMCKQGSDVPANRDIYLSPQQFQAWASKAENYQSSKKEGVFSLGMSLLDLCVMDPSREAYHFTEKTLDEAQVKNRIQISGKKYGGFVQKILAEMLRFEPAKRPTFSELQQQLLLLRKNEDSKMYLSVIPSQQSGYINNDTKSLQSSSMFKSVVSQQHASRSFTSKMKVQKKEEDIESIVENYTNGNKYTGQKKGGMKHGKGKYEFKNGSYYDGQWENNKINGIGELYFPNQKLQYSGEWHNDEFSGWGTQYAEEEQDWQKYEGEFQNGVREGRGKMTFVNGTIYQGEFRSGKISGRGRKISPNGQVVEKHWDTVSPAFFLPDYQ